ncbi:hypothetical protein ABIB26_003153 [Arthrobacter sp. UYEF20]
MGDERFLFGPVSEALLEAAADEHFDQLADVSHLQQ